MLQDDDSNPDQVGTTTDSQTDDSSTATEGGGTATATEEGETTNATEEGGTGTGNPEASGNACFDYTVPGTVTVLAQPSGMTCWATVSTMMLGWHDNQAYTIQAAMDKAGSVYRQKFDADGGLSGSEKPAFLSALGLVAEPPMDYSVQGFLDLLKNYGCLWVTTDEDPSANFAIHARIVAGMFGDGTPDGTSLRIIDPAGGTRYDETYSAFVKKYEEVISQNQPLRVQVVHFGS